MTGGLSLRRLASLVCVALAGCSSTDRALDPNSITLLTYNIHHGRGVDDRIDLERIAGVIRRSGADLVALQEVDRGTGRSGGVDQAARLAELTGLQWRFGEAIPYGGGSYGDAVLARFPIVSSEVWKLPAAPDHEQRVAVGVVCRLPDQSLLRFVGTHLDHTEDPADRIAQTTELVRRAFPTDARALPTVLAGDLNAGPDSEPLRLFLQHFESAAPAGLPSWPSQAPFKSIDWILLTPQSPWSVASAETLDEPLASDHLPLRVVLKR